MDLLRRISSSLIILVTVPLLLATTVTFILSQTVFSETFMKEQVDKNRVYETIADNASSFLPEDDPEVARALDKTVTAEQVRQVLEPGIGQFYAWLTRGGDVVLNVNFRPIKETVKKELSRVKQTALDQFLPDNYEISRATGQLTGFAGFRDRFTGVQDWQRWLPFVTVGLLLLLVLVNSGRARLHRPAYVFFIASLVLGAVGGIGLVILPGLLGGLAGSDIPLKETVEELGRSIGGDIARLTLFVAAGYFAVAALLFIASIFLKEPLPASQRKSV